MSGCLNPCLAMFGRLWAMGYGLLWVVGGCPPIRGESFAYSLRPIGSHSVRCVWVWDFTEVQLIRHLCSHSMSNRWQHRNNESSIPWHWQLDFLHHYLDLLPHTNTHIHTLTHSGSCIYDMYVHLFERLDAGYVAGVELRATQFGDAICWKIICNEL